MKPMRLAIAQTVCRSLPPIISQRFRNLIYPYNLARQDNLKLIAKAQTGGSLEGSTKDFYFYPFSIHGYFDWRNVAIAAAIINNGDTIIEIGANVGTETVSFSDIVGPKGKVFAFEPVPSNIEWLKKASQLSKFRNIVVKKCALSSEEGIFNFVSPPSHASGIGYLAKKGEIIDESIKVKSVTLDSIEREIGKSKLIFIDAEGEEFNILFGAINYLNRYRPHVVLEASPKHLERAGSSFEDLYNLLKKLNYNIYEITRYGLQVVEPENIFNRRQGKNWLCLSSNSKQLVDSVRKNILRSAISPFILGLNPLKAASFFSND